MAPLPFLLSSRSLDDFIQAYNLNYYFELRTPRSLLQTRSFPEFLRSILICFLGIATGIANSI